MTEDRFSPADKLHHLVLSSGVDYALFVEKLEQSLAAVPDRNRASTNLLRFLESGFSGSLIRDFFAYPVLLSVLLDLVSQSQYLADILVRNPELLRWITTTGVLTRVKSDKGLHQEANAAAGLFEHPARKRDALRRFHRREILRIGAADILREASLDDVLGQLSSLADATINACVDTCVSELSAELNSKEIPKLSVIGLGKLGGGELNFSSDIDLMFVYDVERTYSRPLGRYHSYHEVAVRLAERVVRALGDFTAEGHLYRVDMRLRPDGRSGPLALSRSAYVTYYESRGEPWERQMLIKARVVGGDRIVGEKFLSSLRPFVYPRSLLRSPWIDIAAMKEAIERDSDRNLNIKLGAGGIRDIEFLVQGMQILHAGKIPELQSGNTLRTLSTLVGQRLLSQKTGTELTEAYRFFRLVEHRLQLLYGLQTHDLPGRESDRNILAAKLGFASTAEFERVLNGHRDLTRRAFRETIFANERHPEGEGSLAGYRWRGVDPAIIRASHALLGAVSPSGRGLSRFERLMDSPGHRGAAIMACSAKKLRTDFLTSLSLSSIVFERLHNEPLLLETLVGNAAQYLRTSEPAWLESLDGDLRHFRVYNETRTAIRFLAHSASVEVAESELSTAADLAVRTFWKKAGAPPGVVILALGKLGSREMGFRSDLDLVALYDEGRCSRSESESCLKRLLDFLGGGQDGYKVDLRLRPEGKNAPMATDLTFFREYLSERAEKWEWMALMRARSICGDRRLARLIDGILLKPPLRKWAEPGQYLRRMRREMERERAGDQGRDLKIGEGGIADIEFIAQEISLRRRSRGANTYAVLRSTRPGRLLTKKEKNFVIDSLRFLRSVEMLVRLNSQRTDSILPSAGDVASDVANFLGFSHEKEFRASLEKSMTVVRSVFHSFTERLDRIR